MMSVCIINISNDHNIISLSLNYNELFIKFSISYNISKEIGLRNCQEDHNCISQRSNCCDISLQHNPHAWCPATLLVYNGDTRPRCTGWNDGRSTSFHSPRSSQPPPPSSRHTLQLNSHHKDHRNVASHKCQSSCWHKFGHRQPRCSSKRLARRRPLLGHYCGH